MSQKKNPVIAGEFYEPVFSEISLETLYTDF